MSDRPLSEGATRVETADGRCAWSTGQLATLACLLEVSTPKPGNVHRGADFEDLVLNDFLVSATSIGPAMDAAERQGVGRTVGEAVRATRRSVGRNTNLGTVLLLAPLAVVPRHVLLREGVSDVLDDLDAEDARRVYEAIRLAQPGGMGRADKLDIYDPPPDDLRLAMREAAERDLVARQYADGYKLIFTQSVPWLLECRQASGSLTEAIIRTHVRLLHEYPDSLIARNVACEAAARAGAVLASGPPSDPAYHAALADLDFWMRCDGNRRNPGTTADLIAASLFVALREGWLTAPLR
jgi:triphosphoribosyl-dephospho-CoA synthase